MSIRCIVDVRRLPSTVTSVLVASENFTGADGTAWPAQWTALAAFGAATQVGGKGRLQTDVGYKTYREVLAGVNVKNVEVYAEFTPRALTECYPEISVRQSSTAKGPYGDGHVVSMYINPTAGGASFSLGGSLTDTGMFNVAQGNVGTWTIEPWAVRLRAVDSTVTAKIWKVSSGEATAVSVTITDTNFDRSGGVALAYNSGNSTDPGVDWDNVKVYSLDPVAVVTPTTPVTTYSESFTGTAGAAPSAKWTQSKTYPTSATTAGTIKLDGNGGMVLATGSALSWNGSSASIFLGDQDHPEGVSATGAPPIAQNYDYTFRYKLLNLTEQYPSIMLRGRNADLWSGGGGINQFQGGTSMVLGPAGKNIDIVSGYNTATIGNLSNFTFPSNDMYIRIKTFNSRLAFKIWSASLGKAAEPGGVGSDASWTYSNNTVLSSQADGSIGFNVVNGPAAEQKTVTISEFAATTPILTLGTDLTTPPAEPAGFTRILTETFGTAAAAGKSAGQFMAVYSNSFQPYDDGGTIGAGAMYPSQMISAHDGVMDVSSDGQRASAGSFGSPTSAYNRIGGRFSIRMKAFGLFNNGPAFMIWPSDTAQGTWYFGELDFPESVSGRGGNQGFQDPPWIHHHKMVQGQESQAQDVPLNVSWRDWHVYTLEWFPPGSGATPTTGNVRYLVDGVEVYNTQTDVPSTVHRWCFQIGDWGTSGNIYIDWYTIAGLTS